ncbi:hypothetical protein [Streptomyces sp. NPDC021020]|uniref:hypothetical protein n=1 Tax=Streptomyces sp. NPDC021020 TaxID=3365109 RepID=UPI0037900513
MEGRMREVDIKAGMANAYSQGAEPRLVSLMPNGRDELWAVGKFLFVLPAIPPNCPALLEYALRLRREATLTGKCTQCGTAAGLGTFGNFESVPFGEAWLPHRSNCPGADENVIPQLRRHYHNLSKKSFDDSIQEASNRTRERIAPLKTTGFSVNPRFEAWAEMLLDKKTEPGTRRCDHLQANPAQPWNSLIADIEWRCDQCFAYLKQSVEEGELGFDEREEHTCDYCREEVQRLEPLVIRMSTFLMYGGVCAKCHRKLRSPSPPKKVKRRGKNSGKRR